MLHQINAISLQLQQNLSKFLYNRLNNIFLEEKIAFF